MAFGSREDLKEAWTVDISKGGMFIRTDAPPAFGTKLSIRFTTPDGNLALDAEVVHVVDAENAKAFNQPAGVGVQFTDLSGEVRTQFEQYVDGLADNLSGDLPTEQHDYESLEVLIADARRVMDELQASRLYSALDVDPGASRDEIELRVQTLCERFSDPPPDSPPPKVARLERVSRQLERASELVANPLRRLHYDFHNGHIRVEERRTAGEDMAHLREVWQQAFPDKVDKAQKRIEKALALEATDMAACLQVAEEALALDPFNDDLREACVGWAMGNAVTGSVGERAAAPTEDAVDETMIPLIISELRVIELQDKPSNHFELLGVDKNAGESEITKAYLAKSKRYHPEALAGHVTDDVLQVAVDLQTRLDTAYRTLNHPSARQSYVDKLEGKSAAGPQRMTEAMMAFELAKVNLRKGIPGEARKLMEKAHGLVPENPTYAAMYAWSMVTDRCFSRSTATSKGKQLLEEAIETAKNVGPKDPMLIGQWHYYLARLFREAGNDDAAVINYDKALALNPSLKEARTERRVITMRKDKAQ